MNFLRFSLCLKLESVFNSRLQVTSRLLPFQFVGVRACPLCSYWTELWSLSGAYTDCSLQGFSKHCLKSRSWRSYQAQHFVTSMDSEHWKLESKEVRALYRCGGQFQLRFQFSRTLRTHFWNSASICVGSYELYSQCLKILIAHLGSIGKEYLLELWFEMDFGPGTYQINVFVEIFSQALRMAHIWCLQYCYMRAVTLNGVSKRLLLLNNGVKNGSMSLAQC